MQMSNNYQRHNLHHHHCKHCKDHRHQMALHQRFFITQEIFTTHMIMITIIFITMMMMKMIMIMKMNMMKMSLMMMMMMNDMKMITAMIFISFCLQLCSSRKKVIFPQKALNSQNKWMWEFHCHHCHHHHKKYQWSFLGLWWMLATSPNPLRLTSARWDHSHHFFIIIIVIVIINLSQGFGYGGGADDEFGSCLYSGSQGNDPGSTSCRSEMQQNNFLLLHQVQEELIKARFGEPGAI